MQRSSRLSTQIGSLEPLTIMNIKRSKKGARRNREQFISDYTNLLNFIGEACLHKDTQREVLYQEIRMYSGHNGYFDHRANTWISEKAKELCNADSKAKEVRTTIKEHIVPISVSIEWFLAAAKIGNVTEDRVRALLDAASDMCIVSTKEDGLLRTAKLKNCMPEPWTLDTGCRWARYDHENVKIEREPLLKKHNGVYQQSVDLAG
jgi:hypothetical protein